MSNLDLIPVQGTTGGTVNEQLAAMRMNRNILQSILHDKRGITPDLRTRLSSADFYAALVQSNLTQLKAGSVVGRGSQAAPPSATLQLFLKEIREAWPAWNDWVGSQQERTSMGYYGYGEISPLDVDPSLCPGLAAAGTKDQDGLYNYPSNWSEDPSTGQIVSPSGQRWTLAQCAPGGGWTGRTNAGAVSIGGSLLGTVGLVVAVGVGLYLLNKRMK